MSKVRLVLLIALIGGIAGCASKDAPRDIAGVYVANFSTNSSTGKLEDASGGDMTLHIMEDYTFMLVLEAEPPTTLLDGSCTVAAEAVRCIGKREVKVLEAFQESSGGRPTSITFYVQGEDLVWRVRDRQSGGTLDVIFRRRKEPKEA